YFFFSHLSSRHCHDDRFWPWRWGCRCDERRHCRHYTQCSPHRHYARCCAQNVSSAAWILASAYRYFPQGTIFVCVVDPGVGSSRRAIAMHAGDWFFVGPDNGLFSYIFADQPVHAIVALDNPAYHLSQVSSTFHGRDIFAPAGAHLARGVALYELGTQLEPAALQRIEASHPVRHGSRIDARILHVDHFGNLITSIPLSMVPELFSSSQVHIVFPATNAVVDQRRRFFAEGP